MPDTTIDLAGEWTWIADHRRGVNGERLNAGTIIYWPRPGMAYAVAVAPRYTTDEQWAEVAPALAAVPAMLAACKALIHATDAGGPADLIANIAQAAVLARAAVAKAEGR